MKWKMITFVLSVIFCFVEVIESAKILVVMPLPARSHFSPFQPLFEKLVERGDNLTIIAGHRLNEKFQSNYTLVDVKPIFSKLKIVFTELRKRPRILRPLACNNVYQDYIEEVLKFSDVQDLIHSNAEYDLVIAEMFYIDAIFAFGNKFKAPVIAICATPTVHAGYNWIYGNPFPSSHVPNVFLPFTEKMTLFARIINMVFNQVTILFYEFISLPRSQAQIEKYFHFDKENMPRIKDIMKKVPVTLVNAHYSFGYIKADLPNFVNVAGIHFTSPTPLPQTIQTFMDEAEYGVIYLSLGSLIEPSKIEKLGRLFINLMGNLPQRVLMKWDPRVLEYIPENILVQEWVPQMDVLNHPNCRLFITHGGGLSILESLNASVPLIGIPFFGDHQNNMAIVEYYEIGTELKIDDISDQLLSKIHEILNNSKYKENIVKRSRVFRERLTKPLDTAIYWIDHVLEHKDTSHLRSASAQLTWYELYSVDVLAILAAIIWITVKAVMFIIRRLVQKMESVKTELLSNAKSRRIEKGRRPAESLKHD